MNDVGLYYHFCCFAYVLYSSALNYGWTWDKKSKNTSRSASNKSNNNNAKSTTNLNGKLSLKQLDPRNIDVFNASCVIRGTQAIKREATNVGGYNANQMQSASAQEKQIKREVIVGSKSLSERRQANKSKIKSYTGKICDLTGKSSEESSFSDDLANEDDDSDTEDEDSDDNDDDLNIMKENVTLTNESKLMYV